MPRHSFPTRRSSDLPITELSAPEGAYRFTRGLGLAHMDAHLRGVEPAARFLAGDLIDVLRSQGVVATLA